MQCEALASCCIPAFAGTGSEGSHYKIWSTSQGGDLFPAKGAGYKMTPYSGAKTPEIELGIKIKQPEMKEEH